ncbi:MAG: redoxin domain-containing protein [Planctomycetaceae bacterium]|nr:redoxin domain-containing protein [Planctomycetaceae bacterium]
MRRQSLAVILFAALVHASGLGFSAEPAKKPQAKPKPPRATATAPAQSAPAEAPPTASAPGDAALVETPALPYLTLFLARDPTVHAELKLTAQQTAKLSQAIAEVDNEFWVLRDVPVAKCGDKLDALLARLREGIAQTLSADQRQRFDQLVVQARGYRGLVAPDLAAKVNLSDEQVTRIKKLLVAASEPAGAGAAGSDQASSPKSASAGAPNSRAILDVLDDKQLAQLTRLTGEPFELGRVRQIGCVAPELRDVSAWINTDGLDLKSKRGQVVALHFWAFGCINCIRNLPHYQGWYEKFPKSELTIVGIHTPETQQEKSLESLQANVKERGIQYPVAFDAASENWKAWGNNMWPSVYLIDKRGQVRYWWYGELNWEGARGEEFLRQKIAELIAEK